MCCAILATLNSKASRSRRSAGVGRSSRVKLPFASRLAKAFSPSCQGPLTARLAGSELLEGMREMCVEDFILQG